MSEIVCANCAEPAAYIDDRPVASPVAFCVECLPKGLVDIATLIEQPAEQ